VVAATLNGDVLALDAITRADKRVTIRWQHHLDKPIFSSPALDVNRELLAVGCADSYLYCWSWQGDLVGTM
jgi:outer membrane protein assembly factor BamB